MPFLQPNVTRIGSGVNAIGPGADIYATKAEVQAASQVSISSGNGTGIVVTENPANTFAIETDLIAGNGISVTASNVNESITIANTGVLSVTAGTNVSVTGTLSAPTVNVTGVVTSVSQGTNITVTGTSQNPIINAVINLNPNLVLDVFDSTPISVNTPAGGAATVLTTLGGFVPETIYQISLTGFLQASANNLGVIMTMFLQPVGGGENLTLFQCPVTATEYGFSVSAVVKTPFIPSNPNPTTSYNVMVGGGGGLTTEIITGSIANAAIIKTN